MYISLELAKLAKEVGYSKGTSTYYEVALENFIYDNDENHRESYKIGDVYIREEFMYHKNSHKNYDGSNDSFVVYERCTQSELSEWIRMNYEIDVITLPQYESTKCGYDSFMKIGYHAEVAIPYAFNNSISKCTYLGYPMFTTIPNFLLDEEDPTHTLEDEEYVVSEKYEEAFTLGLAIALKTIKSRTK